MSEVIVRKVAQIERRLDNLIFPEAGAGGVLPAVAAAGYALVSDGVNSWAADQTPLWTGEHSFAAGIAFTGASDANEITVPDDTAIALELLDVGGLEYMRIVSTDANPYVLFDPAGAGINLGIGTAAPEKNLHIAGAVRASVALEKIGTDMKAYAAYQGNTFGLLVNRDFAGAISDATKAAGAISIAGLNVNSHIKMYTTNVNNVAPTEYWGLSNLGAVRFNAYGAGDLQTDANGNITAVSDARLKEQVRDTEVGLAEVLQMQGKRWHWTKESGLDTEFEYQGFIADDIEKIVPAAVGRDARGMRTMSYSSLMPAFAAAIQELNVRLGKLETH